MKAASVNSLIFMNHEDQERFKKQCYDSMNTLNELCDQIEAKATARGDEIVHVNPATDEVESKPGRLVVVEIQDPYLG